MTAKEYLSKLHKLDIKINKTEEEIAELNETITSIGSALASSDRVSSSQKSSAGYTYQLERLIKLKENVIERKIQLALDRDKVIKEIFELENSLYIEVLFRRYVKYQPLKEISKELNYDYGYIRKAHGWALLEFSKKINR